MSVSLGVLLNGEEIGPGDHSWINRDDGELNTSIRVGRLSDINSVSIQGTPKDMDRLAKAARTAAAQARAAEPELRAKATSAGEGP